eukprot:252454-Pyramimonas_sp.AAC.1
MRFPGATSHLVKKSNTSRNRAGVAHPTKFNIFSSDRSTSRVTPGKWRPEKSRLKTLADIS